FIPRLRLAGGSVLAAALLAWCFRAWGASALADTLRRAFVEWTIGTHALKALVKAWPSALPLLLVTALAAGARLLYLFQPMRYDEAVTHGGYAANPIYLLLCKYDFPNNHVFHSLCVHLTCRLFGDDPWAIRLPA